MDMSVFKVLLDLAEYELEPIVDNLLNAMSDDRETVTRSELKSLIFTNASCTVLSDIIQARGISLTKTLDWARPHLSKFLGHSFQSTWRRLLLGANLAVRDHHSPDPQAQARRHRQAEAPVQPGKSRRRSRCKITLL